MIHPTVSDALHEVPARMLNEVVYCPRLAYIEWVEGEFRHNAYTAEGKLRHRRVDQEGGSRQQPSAGGEGGPGEGDPGDMAPSGKVHARSVYLSAPREGLVARLDLVEAEGELATPVDYKRGSPPNVPEQCHEPERVQLCAQALILEENGFCCERGILYFTGAKRRVEVPLTDALRARTRAAAQELRDMVRGQTLPPVLEDDARCVGCSLSGVCLPDEIDILRRDAHRARPPRRLFPARDDALPLHVHARWGKVGCKAETLQVRAERGEPTEVRVGELSSVSLYGNVQLSTQAMRKLAQRGVPVCLFSMGGWFYGMIQGLPHSNVRLRKLQFEAATAPASCLRVAQALVRQKIKNQRTLLRRNAREAPEVALGQLKQYARKVDDVTNLKSLLGLEGSAARVYFGQFTALLRPTGGELVFHMDGRSRRPPTDPVNALLSFAYALLVKDLTITATVVGFDPHLGFYHQQRPGRPSLALDLMEPFRPIVADSVVITAVNNGVVRAADFTTRLGAVSIADAARKRFIRAYERRMNELVTHPVFGYRISYRRVLEVQTRLLGRHLAGEIPQWPPFLTR